MNYNHEKTLIFKCSQEDFEKLQELFEDGDLSRALGVEVIDMGITSIETTQHSTKQTALGQMLKKIIQPTKKFVDVSDTNVDFAYRNKDKQSKQTDDSSIRYYNFVINLDGKNVELTVKIQPSENIGAMDVNLEVKPSKNKLLLPTELKLILLENSKIIEEVVARNGDSIVKRSFIGSAGDNFSVKIALGDFSIVEDFTI